MHGYYGKAETQAPHGREFFVKGVRESSLRPKALWFLFIYSKRKAQKLYKKV
jgi:hypothetical protein